MQLKHSTVFVNRYPDPAAVGGFAAALSVAGAGNWNAFIETDGSLTVFETVETKAEDGVITTDVVLRAKIKAKLSEESILHGQPPA